MIKALYFDVGGVLVKDGFAMAAPLFSEKLDIDQYKMVEAYLKTDDWRYAAGLIGKERWQKMFKLLGVRKKVEPFMEIWHNTYVPIEKSVKILESLKGKFWLGVLADQPKDMIPHLMQYDFFKLFDEIIWSCDTGHAKTGPGIGIFKIALKKCPFKPEEILFIDNKRANLDKAEEVGIKTLIYMNPEQLKKDLRKIIRPSST